MSPGTQSHHHHLTSGPFNTLKCIPHQIGRLYHRLLTPPLTVFPTIFIILYTNKLKQGAWWTPPTSTANCNWHLQMDPNLTFPLHPPSQPLQRHTPTISPTPATWSLGQKLTSWQVPTIRLRSPHNTPTFCPAATDLGQFSHYPSHKMPAERLGIHLTPAGSHRFETDFSLPPRMPVSSSGVHNNTHTSDLLAPTAPVGLIIS